MRKTTLFIAAALAVATPATFAQTAFAQTAPAGEQLIAHYPQGWQPNPLPTPDPNVKMTRLLPPNESPQNFSEAIVVERYANAKQSAKDFVATVIDLGKKGCDGFLGSPPTERTVNGYKAVSARFGCTKGARTGKSGVIMVIAINGKDALQVIQSMWLGAPVAANQPIPIPEEVIRRWDSFEQSVVLCDTRDSKHPCPAAQ